jgi:esterase
VTLPDASDRLDSDFVADWARSGDVRLYCRKFGAPGGTPIIIMHGANYYDSYDWIDVARALAHDRVVVSFDHRGFGESDWSASKNYSVDTMMADIRAVITHFGWRRVAILGHSASGRLAISLAANFPDWVESVTVVDSAFGKEENDAPKPKHLGVGAKPLVFDNIEEAMARFAKRSNPPRFALDKDRAMHGLKRIPDGWMLKRDPDYRNARPIDGADVRPVRELDVWQEITRVRCPTLLVRGLRSDRFSEEIVARVRGLQPSFHWAEVDSRHDVAFESPHALVEAVTGFLR